MSVQKCVLNEVCLHGRYHEFERTFLVASLQLLCILSYHLPHNNTRFEISVKVSADRLHGTLELD